MLLLSLRRDMAPMPCTVEMNSLRISIRICPLTAELLSLYSLSGRGLETASRWVGREAEAARFPCPGPESTARYELFITCTEGSSLEMQAFVKHRQRQSSSPKVATNSLEQSLHLKKKKKKGVSLGLAQHGDLPPLEMWAKDRTPIYQLIL